ncbi:MAG: succinate dehydrogenase iron-sulfur subunit [Anaerolineaceae bacterium 4572_78]|nr:MAG: succinate dehydrogenase iron-sulfur subunit [Anaerolineaceae bacterium 4572_78]
MKKRTLKIKRFNPTKDKKPYWQEFVVEAEDTDRILDALNHIKWYVDGSLTMRRSCAHGICGSDAMCINGKNLLACKALFKEVGDDVTIEPLAGLPVIRDLVVDMEPFMEHYRTVLPYFISETPPPSYGERLQSIEERKIFDDTTKCILCAACTTSCPSFWARGEYIGPSAIVQAHRFIFDSRDDGAAARLDILGNADGVWRCRTIYNCTNACPRGIEVTKAVGEVKKEILFSTL